MTETFEDFVATLASMPHVCAKIIRNLDIPDVVNCLRTSRTLRASISQALEYDKKLQADLDRAVANFTSSNCKWNSSECYSIGTIDGGSHGLLMNAICLDDQMWMSLEKTYSLRNNSDLGLYKLGKDNIETISMDTFAKIQVLKSGQVLVDDGRDVMVARSCDCGKIDFENVHERLCTQKEVRTYGSHTLMTSKKVTTGSKLSIRVQYGTVHVVR